MSKPKLTYFDFAGSRGEEVRLALHIGGVEFEDNRIAFAEWSALKPQTPWGSLPTFEIEGKGTLAQCNAILSYVGREHGLLPKDSWECARHEALMAACEELRATVMPALHLEDKDASKAAREQLATEFLPGWAAKVEEKLGEGPFVAGSELSVADIKLYMVSKWFSSGGVDHVPEDVFATSPKLQALEQAVKTHPKVVEWYARD